MLKENHSVKGRLPLSELLEGPEAVASPLGCQPCYISRTPLLKTQHVIASRHRKSNLELISNFLPDG